MRSLCPSEKIKKMIFLKMLSRKWLFVTLFVCLVAASFVRLGIWQLDRLEQRRIFNAQFEGMRASPPLDLNQTVPENIESMEWRAVTVTGEYDLDHQIALRNQYYENQY